MHIPLSYSKDAQANTPRVEPSDCPVAILPVEVGPIRRQTRLYKDFIESKDSQRNALTVRSFEATTWNQASAEHPPIRHQELRILLQDHPNKEWARSVVAAVSNEGADLGHRGPIIPFVAPYNRLDQDQVTAARTTIQERLSNRWVIGPIALDDPILEEIRPVISPWFLVPKAASTPGIPKFREIQDLTRSKVNDSIPSEDHVTEYGKFSDALAIVILLGRGCYMFIVDVAHAYRNIKLQERWWRLTAFRILNLIFIDTRLPMGSRSSPYLWMQLVIAFMWILRTAHGVTNLVDYMDDFFGAEARRADAERNLKTFLQTAEQINLPIAPEKIQQGQVVEFLGICIDSKEWRIFFSEKKRQKLERHVSDWLRMKFFTKKHLQSMIGKLIHASIVYFGGGTFTKPLIHQLKKVKNNSIRASSHPEIELSLKWWEKALRLKGDRPITEHITSPTFQFWSEASLKLGVGAVHKNQWFAIPWKQENPWFLNCKEMNSEMHINILELLAVVLSCAIWGHTWTGCRVLIHCDNTAVCTVVTDKRSKDEIMNHLLMLLHYIQIHFGFDISIQHIATKDNVNADDVSRFKFRSFFARNPAADKVGQSIPWSELPKFQLNKAFLSLPTIDQASLIYAP